MTVEANRTSVVGASVHRLPTASARFPFIQVEGLSKRYVSRDSLAVDAVEAASFDIAHGEFVSLVGPSGCGKTTLLMMIGGLVEPSGGSIHFDMAGTDGDRPQLGMVFQDAVLLPWRTVFQNVMLPVEVMHLPRSEGENRARQLIKLVGLAGFEDKFPFELSGGMQQRASIARALVSDPALLLMDEPFAALDAMLRESMAMELQRIWSISRKTVLFVTHSIAEAVFLSDRILVMSQRPSRIQKVVRVPLGRPRDLRMMTASDFTDCVAHVRSVLYSGEVTG